MIEKSYRDIIKLIYCVLHNETPSFEEEPNYKEIYTFAKTHSLLSIVSAGLERYPSFKEVDPRIQQAFSSAHMAAVRKAISFDAERSAILKEFDKEKIANLPLKGVILNAMYPEPGLREFADNDIYYDKKKQKQMVNIFKARHYEVESLNHGNHDVFQKAPFYNFEMHRGLLPDHEGLDKARNYFLNVKKIAIKNNDDPSSFGYHMSDENFYLFHTAHAYKHYSICGNGLRYPMDTYVYLKAKGETLDWSFIQTGLEKMGMASFEKDMRELALHLFEKADFSLSEKEEKDLEYILSCGTYGTIDHSVDNWLESHNHSKLGYIWHRLWPGRKAVKEMYPVLYYSIIGIPFIILWRAIKGLFFSKGKGLREASIALSNKKKDKE